MKTLCYLLTLFVLISNLQARENPFMPTQTYAEEKARLMELESDYPAEFQEGNATYEKMTPPKPMPVAKTQKELDAEKKAKEAKMMAQKRAKMMAEKKAMMAKKKKEMALKKAKELEAKLAAEKKALEEAKKNPMIYVKYREDIEVNEKMNILPFLKVEYTNESLKILSKYKVFKKFYLEKEKKLILDFRGTTKFFTRHQDLESKNFKKISIGNHRPEKFFRVVLMLTQDPKKYSVTYAPNEVLVSLNEEMAQ